MKKLWGFVNLVGLLIAAAGFITHSAVLIVLGIAVCLLGEWQKSRVSKAQRAQAQTGAIRPALADVFDALVSKRCYKEAFTYDKAFSIIREDSGSHFDPILAPIFCTCRPELEAYYDNCEK